jgi:hypothetical protein
MKRVVKVLMSLLVALPCLARDPLTLSNARELAAADAATPEGQAYLKGFFTNPWRLALNDANEHCRDAQLRSGSHEEFVIALSIGIAGFPIESLTSPDDEGMKCLARRLMSTEFIKPPYDGFAIYMPFKNTEPGTERRATTSSPGGSSNQ